MIERKERLGAIIRSIANNPGITLNGLCSKLAASGISVTERTIAKDILELKNEYKLLPAQPRLRNGYVLEQTTSLSESEVELVLDLLHVFGVRLNDPEATSLLNRLLARRQSSFSARAKSPRKAAQPLRRSRVSMRTIRQRDIYAGKTKDKQMQSVLSQAMRAHQCVHMTYLTPRIGQPVKLKGYPLLLVFHERGWYCIVKDAKTNEYHPRRIDRIQSCSVVATIAANTTHQGDLVEAEFLMSCGWGMTFPRSTAELREGDEKPEIVVRFDRTLAPYILESFERHPRGVVSRVKDGTGDAQFKIRLSNPQEFLHWVRSFGSRAWIVSPSPLVEQERADLRRLLNRYS